MSIGKMSPSETISLSHGWSLNEDFLVFSIFLVIMKCLQKKFIMLWSEQTVLLSPIDKKLFLEAVYFLKCPIYELKFNVYWIAPGTLLTLVLYWVTAAPKAKMC